MADDCERQIRIQCGTDDNGNPIFVNPSTAADGSLIYNLQDLQIQVGSGLEIDPDDPTCLQQKLPCGWELDPADPTCYRPRQTVYGPGDTFPADSPVRPGLPVPTTGVVFIIDWCRNNVATIDAIDYQAGA